MRILVYGAGVLGCNLAHDLYRAKKDVTILARSVWAARIQQDGLVIKHLCRTTRDRIKVVTQLEKDDVYVVSQKLCQKRPKKTAAKKTCRDMVENRGITGEMAVL